MKNENEQKQLPTYRLWLVQEKEGEDDIWTELAPLWPTRSGKGFTGLMVNRNVLPDRARLVLLPSRTPATSKGGPL